MSGPYTDATCWMLPSMAQYLLEVSGLPNENVFADEVSMEQFCQEHLIHLSEDGWINVPDLERYIEQRGAIFTYGELDWDDGLDQWFFKDQRISSSRLSENQAIAVKKFCDDHLEIIAEGIQAEIKDIYVGKGNGVVFLEVKTYQKSGTLKMLNVDDFVKFLKDGGLFDEEASAYVEGLETIGQAYKLKFL